MTSLEGKPIAMGQLMSVGAPALAFTSGAILAAVAKTAWSRGVKQVKQDLSQVRGVDSLISRTVFPNILRMASDLQRVFRI